MTSRPPRRTLAAAAVVLAAGCGGSGTTSSDAPSTFLAFSSTFEPFRGWSSYHSDGPADDGTFPADVLGPRTQYINKLPPRGVSEFPVGTVIVEARENTSKKIFGAVKRGGGFNLGGATNWEWFELQEAPVVIVWRGVGPPAGDTYGGDPDGGCNSCHMKCGANNDFICSPKLALSTF